MVLSGLELNHDNNILCLGSCFAETIGDYLSQFKFKVSTNPLGTIFNPIAISNVINWGIKPFDFDKNRYTLSSRFAVYAL